MGIITHPILLGTTETMVNFLIKQRPKPQQRHRNNGRFHYDPSSQDKKEFILQAKEYAPKNPSKNGLDAKFTFCYKRPSTHYKTKDKKPVLKEKAPYYRKAKPDIDNLVKFYMDCCSKLFYVDDAQVTSINAVKVYGQEDYVHIKLAYNKNYCK